MRAVVLERYGGPEVLQLREVPDLVPGPGEVRVAVANTALNRADTYQREGKYPQPGEPPAFEIPGLEFAGTVDQLGDGVSRWAVGDRVCGLLPGGGYASQVVTSEHMCLRIPSTVDFVAAAGIPEVFLTAYDALLDKANFRPAQDVVLVHAAGSGVGTAATQLARVLKAPLIMTTTRSQEKSERSRALGADHVFVTADGRFADQVLLASNHHGADVILDFMGASYMEENLRAAASGARVVLIATLGGSKAEVSIARLMRQRIRLTGTTLRNRSPAAKAALTEEFRAFMSQFKTGELTAVIDRTFSLDEVADAHRHMETNANFGKIVLTI